MLNCNLTCTMLMDESLMVEFSWSSSKSSSLTDTTCRHKEEQHCWGHQQSHFCFTSYTTDFPTGPTHLRVFASQVSVHGSPGGHLSTAEVTWLGLYLLVCQVNVFLKHVLRQVLLIAGWTCPRLTNCRQGNWVSAVGCCTVKQSYHFLQCFNVFVNQAAAQSAWEAEQCVPVLLCDTCLCGWACVSPESSSHWTSFHITHTWSPLYLSVLWHRKHAQWHSVLSLVCQSCIWPHPSVRKCMRCKQLLHTQWLTCVSLVVFQHVDLLGKLAVTLFALILFDAFVELHVVPQSVFGLHACIRLM